MEDDHTHALDALRWAFAMMQEKDTAMAAVWNTTGFNTLGGNFGLTASNALGGGISVAPYTNVAQPYKSDTLREYLLNAVGAYPDPKGWYHCTVMGKDVNGAPKSCGLFVDAETGSAPNCNLRDHLSEVTEVRPSMNPSVVLWRVVEQLRAQLGLLPPAPRVPVPPMPYGLHDYRAPIYTAPKTPPNKAMHQVNRVRLTGYDHNGHLQMKTMPGNPMPVSPDAWVRVSLAIDDETDDELPWLTEALNGALHRHRTTHGKMTQAEIEALADSFVENQVEAESAARQQRLEAKHDPALRPKDKGDGVVLWAISHAEAARLYSMSGNMLERSLARTSMFADNPRDVLRGRTLTVMEAHIADDQTASPAYGGVLDDLSWKE